MFLILCSSLKQQQQKSTLKKRNIEIKVVKQQLLTHFWYFFS